MHNPYVNPANYKGKGDHMEAVKAHELAFRWQAVEVGGPCFGPIKSESLTRYHASHSLGGLVHTINSTSPHRDVLLLAY